MRVLFVWLPSAWGLGAVPGHEKVPAGGFPLVPSACYPDRQVRENRTRVPPVNLRSISWLSGPMDEWSYVIDRIDEERSAPQIAGDTEAKEDILLLLARVKNHVARSGTVSADEPQRCAVDGQPFPCPTLKHEAKRWRDREDFPKHLI